MRGLGHPPPPPPAVPRGRRLKTLLCNCVRRTKMKRRSPSVRTPAPSARTRRCAGSGSRDAANSHPPLAEDPPSRFLGPRFEILSPPFARGNTRDACARALVNSSLSHITLPNTPAICRPPARASLAHKGAVEARPLCVSSSFKSAAGGSIVVHCSAAVCTRARFRGGQAPRPAAPPHSARSGLN